MNHIDDLPEKVQTYFREMVDECFLENQSDPELKEGFDILDAMSRKQKISIYDLVLQLYEEDEFYIRINEWKKSKGYT